MLVLFPMVIVDVGAGNQIFKWFEAISDAFLFRAFGEIRVPNIEVET